MIQVSEGKILLLFIIITFVILLCIIINYRIRLKFINISNQKLDSDNVLLKNENINLLQKVAILNAEIEQLNKTIIIQRESKSEAFHIAKSSILEFGNNLSQHLIESNKKEIKEARELSEKNVEAIAVKFNSEFERIVHLVGALNKEVENSNHTNELIKRSLLSPTGAGKLAEITLENILKASGLRNQIDFSIQHNLISDDNESLRPDALIFLPSNNLMVIDAKASKFLIDNQNDSLQLLKTMNFHLKSLSSKEYSKKCLESFSKAGSECSHIFTLMFLPSEHAIEKIIDIDNQFLEKAWKLNILPVGPAGLMNMLSFAKFQISDNMRSENHKMILDEIQKLLSGIGIMAEFANKLGVNIQNIVSNYDKFAGSFNRNFLSRAKKITQLGIDAPNVNKNNSLERYTIISNKSELIELESDKEMITDKRINNMILMIFLLKTLKD
jgi:DNA recombination protein RmuC